MGAMLDIISSSLMLDDPFQIPNPSSTLGCGPKRCPQMFAAIWIQYIYRGFHRFPKIGLPPNHLSHG